MTFWRKKKPADPAAPDQRLYDEFVSRAALIVSRCETSAVERYRRLPSANSTRSCSKCGETNLSRSFLRMRANHRPLCQGLRGEAQLLGVEWVGHDRFTSFEVLSLYCYSCGATPGVEKTADADTVLRIRENAARRNGMGIPVHEEDEA